MTAAAALAISTLSANAGGLSPEIIETPPVVVDTFEPAGSSVDPTFVVLGILALLLIAASGSSNSEPTIIPQ
ncbi:MAG: hypothetical protein IBX59_04825 [Yoonia sp.]|nr:hypothetical protein [Yoonia sp.]